MSDPELHFTSVQPRILEPSWESILKYRERTAAVLIAFHALMMEDLKELQGKTQKAQKSQFGSFKIRLDFVNDSGTKTNVKYIILGTSTDLLKN